jgi:peptide methionine sulfoxide reductase msrA/msrB
VLLLAGWIGPGQAGEVPSPGAEGSRWVIDDFSAQARKAARAAIWQFVAERGTAAGSVRMEEQEGRTCLHLMGTVSPTAKAGPIEARRSLYVRGQPFDARAYEGIQLIVKGTSGSAALHLRTREARSLGQYYRIEFPLSGQWQEIKLPFGKFLPAAMRPPLNPAQLMSISVVAGQNGSQADVYIDEIAFYRERTMYRQLTPAEERVIVHKGTEAPFTGKYDRHFEKGVYTCKRCGSELFESASKFRSDCGWPSFDEQIPGRVQWQTDADGRRTEVICNNCGAHLGHVFLGEGYTEKNTRYCVNSISMDFIPAEKRAQKTDDAVGAGPRARPDGAGQPQGVAPTNPQSAIRNPQSTARALFASGCFWGTEYYLQRAGGVISTTVGFSGGHVENPTYKQVCTGRTGHAETVEVIYDPAKTSYEQLARLFFETHDFTQVNRQGPDIGPQYRSAIFYLDDEQKQIAERLVRQLRQMGYDVKTEITPAGKFWVAEDYHQDYYNTTGKTPYCHVYRPIFPPQPVPASRGRGEESLAPTNG